MTKDLLSQLKSLWQKRFVEFGENFKRVLPFTDYNDILSKGVTIGEGCVIGANSLVLSDIPPKSKAFGTPCRVIGKVGSRKP